MLRGPVRLRAPLLEEHVQPARRGIGIAGPRFAGQAFPKTNDLFAVVHIRRQKAEGRRQKTNAHETAAHILTFAIVRA